MPRFSRSAKYGMREGWTSSAGAQRGTPGSGRMASDTFFLLASLHCMGRERTRLRVRFALAPACLVYRSCELHCSAVISIEYEWSANPSDARCVSKFKMQIGQCGCDALRAPTETQDAIWVHDEAARLGYHLCLLHFGDGSIEAL